MVCEDSWECRIIPALAGNTVVCNGDVYDNKDHPRSRGEYMPALIRTSFLIGSSPLSRGIPPLLRCTPWRARIIPALAGNTYLEEAPRHCLSDHPRSRGEY